MIQLKTGELLKIKKPEPKKKKVKVIKMLNTMTLAGRPI